MTTQEALSHDTENFHRIIYSFQESSSALTNVGRFVAEGICRNEGIVIIACFEHMEKIKDQLKKEMDVDIESAIQREQVVLINSSRFLAKLMDGRGAPDRFKESLDPVLKKMKFRFKDLRVYEEVTRKLWCEGNLKAAITLKRLWRDEAKDFNLQIVRADPLSGEAGFGQLLSMQQNMNDLHVQIEQTKALQRQHEITLQELQAAKEELKQLHQSKNQILSMISHGIRRPLASLLEQYEMITAFGISTEQKDLSVKTIVEAAKQLAQVTGDLFAPTAMDASFEVQKSKLKFLPFLQDTLITMYQTAEKKGLEIESQINGTIPDVVETDPHLLRALFLKLMQNAVQATEKGSISFSIKFHAATEKSPHKMDFYVRDTGQGLTKQEISQLFLPETSASESNADKPHSGLFFARMKARALGGDIQLIGSNPDSGSLLKLTMEF